MYYHFFISWVAERPSVIFLNKRPSNNPRTYLTINHGKESTSGTHHPNPSYKERAQTIHHDRAYYEEVYREWVRRVSHRIRPQLRLAGTRSNAYGIAEMYDRKTSRWGTVCDVGRLSVDGWPSVFCRTMGYEKAEQVVYARVTLQLLDEFSILNSNNEFEIPITN